MRSVQKVSRHKIWKIETFIEENTRNVVHRTMTPQSPSGRHLRTSHSSPNCHQLTCCILLYLINSLKSLPFQRWFYFWEKPDVRRHQLWAVRVLSHLGDFMFHPKILHKAWCMSEHVVVMKLPITRCP